MILQILISGFFGVTGKTSYKARGLISSVSGKRSLSVRVKEKGIA